MFLCDAGLFCVILCGWSVFVLFLGVGVVCGLGSLGIQILDSEVRNVGVCVVLVEEAF